MGVKAFFEKLINFMKEVINDQRIPGRDKKVLAALVLLIISPIDFIPDWIPILGQLDDLMMGALILDYFFTVLDSVVLLSHWPWGMKSFSWIKRLARTLGVLAPRFLKRALWKYTGDPY